MDIGIRNTIRFTIGSRIKKAYEEDGLSLQEFCDKINESPLIPKKIRNGKITNEHEVMNFERMKRWVYGTNPVDLDWLPAICDVLSCDIGYLFAEYSGRHRINSDIISATGLSPDSVEVITCKTDFYKWTNRLREKEANGLTVTEEDYERADEERSMAETSITLDYCDDLISAGKIVDEDEFWESHQGDVELQRRLKNWDTHFIDNYSIDREGINSLLTSPYFGNFIESLVDCADMDSTEAQDDTLDDRISVGPHARERKILLAQWYAGLIAKSILDKAESEGSDNG